MGGPEKGDAEPPARFGQHGRRVLAGRVVESPTTGTGKGGSSMAVSQRASPGAIIAAVVILLVIVGGLWWKFMGPGAHEGGTEEPDQGAPTMQAPAGAPGGPGAPGPAG